MDTVRAFRRATHHQIRHVGGQNRRRQLKGAEPHRQRQPNQPRLPSAMPARRAIAATIGISSAMRPMLEGITNAVA